MTKRKTTRRDFLSGNVVNKTTDGHGLSQNPGSKANVEETYLEHYSKNAMACEFAVLLNMHQHTGGADATMKAFQLIDQLEQQLSIYREDSEISRLNRDATESAVGVESGLYQLLKLASELSSTTNGAFDITSGPISDLWGFSRREGSVPQQSEIEKVLKRISYQNVKFLSDHHVELHDGANINLGGIGKGYALDLAANLITDLKVTNFVIHGGQSSVIARGAQTEKESLGKEDETPVGRWTIGLSHPTMPDTRLAEIYLADQALGTSGTGRQGFFHNGKRYGHIIDPRTGWPTDHCLSSTVIADQASVCDALATAFFVMKPEEVAKFCEEQKHIKAILVLPDGPGGKTIIESFNLADNEWKLL